MTEQKKHKHVYEPEEEYPRNFQLALGITLVLFILMFLGVKAFEVTPYTPTSEVATLVEAEPEELQDIEEPPPPPKPKLPVEAESDEVVEEEIEEEEILTTTDFDELEAPPPPKTEEVFEFYAVEVKPQVLKTVEPVYPEMAKKAGIEGRVTVKAMVNEEGRVTYVEIIQSTNPIFDEPAKRAAMGFLFKPGMQRDRPVKVYMAIPFRFQLIE
jgi:protein TonB